MLPEVSLRYKKFISGLIVLAGVISIIAPLVSNVYIGMITKISMVVSGLFFVLGGVFINIQARKGNM